MASPVNNADETGFRVEGSLENDPKQSWAEDMRSLLRETLHARHEAERVEASAFPSENVRAFQRRYDAILEQAAGKIRFLSVSPDNAESSAKKKSAVSLTV